MTNDYGIEVKKELIEIGKTQKELSKEVGISNSNLNMILNGHRNGWKHRHKIASILEKSKKRKIDRE